MRRLFLLIFFACNLQAFFSERTLCDLIAAYQDDAVKKMLSQPTRVIAPEQKIKALACVTDLIDDLENSSKQYSLKDRMRILSDLAAISASLGLESISTYVLLHIQQTAVSSRQQESMRILSYYTMTLCTCILAYAFFDIRYTIKNPDRNRRLRAALAIKHYLGTMHAKGQ